MAKKTKREQIYAEQLRALGIYDPAFDPEIKALASLEREWTMAKKAWSATVPEGCKPSFLDPHYAVIQNLRREILAHREALGLTPKSLRRLRGATATETTGEQDLLSQKLDEIARRTAAYSGAIEAGPYSGTESHE